MDAAVAEGGTRLGDRPAKLPAGIEITLQRDLSKRHDHPNVFQQFQFLHQIWPAATKFLR